MWLLLVPAAFAAVIYLGSFLRKHVKAIDIAFELFQFVFAAIFIFYFVLPVWVWLKYKMGLARIPPGRGRSHVWNAYCVEYFDVKLINIGEDEAQKHSRTLFCCPHRTWADFFLHRVLTHGYAANLARKLIAVAFPLLYLMTRDCNSIWFFDNNNVRSDLKEWLDTQFVISKTNSMILYPEQSRNRALHPRPLRRGIIYFAYSRKIPIQILMTNGAENVINEHCMRVHFGGCVKYKFSPPIEVDERKFPTREEFFDHVEVVFRATFYEVYQTTPRLE